MQAGGGLCGEDSADGLYDIEASLEGSRCVDDDLESVSEDDGNICLPEEEPCRYVTEECGDE